MPLGGAVGYAVRFDDKTGKNTLVRLVTDGLLLAEIQRDRFLRRYDTIILDEAHERSLNIDFLLGFLKQLLPRRPDLKLVITSATIDTARFSEHFGGAPVVEVSGRTYPVEVRYRPAAEEDDPVDAIGDAVEELLDDAPGDVLVFLSGEREIRDTAEALAARLPREVGVLPLYARLSPAEQQKVFKPHSERRVVLATNVAETSLTVPGIGAVVDPGTARISRYSARLKVQRLPIEPVSQASANQRKGRCGRTSDGICVRLYSEEDFAERPAFTDPEILRTSLASVILQMASLGLGEVEDFGFLDPPDRRQIRDGKALLHELGALDPEAKDPRKRLTALGRKLAQLPVDPRIGRMVLEAGRAGCADEVVVIAAALSIQDPRIRPAEKRGEADEQHARFVDKDARSDFLAYLNLWRHLRARQKEMSRNGFRKMCHAEYLHYMRVREWQDLAGQLRQAARNVGVTINEQPAAPDDVHRALLAGLLSHVGLRNGASREYDGARGARFTLSPGSALARKPPVWVMVAELVETARLYGHTAAQIQPRWIEPLAGHLLKRTYSEPHWERKRASVVATERATLYGVPVVGARTVPYGPIDPVLSRELFIRHALLEGDWTASHRFLQDNRRVARGGRGARAPRAPARHRRRPRPSSTTSTTRGSRSSVVSGAHFDRWWKDARRREPELLRFTRELLVGDAGIDESALPDVWRQGDLELALTYRFEPGADGRRDHRARPAARAATATRRRLRLARAGPARGARHRVDPLVAQGPAPAARADPGDGGRGRGGAAPAARFLVAAVAREIERVRGVHVEPSQFDLRAAARVPAGAVRGGGRARRGARRGRGPRRAAGAAAPAPARPARGGDGALRAQRPARLDARRAAAQHRAAGHGRHRARLPGAGRRGRQRRGTGVRDSRARRRPRCTRARARCCASSWPSPLRTVQRGPPGSAALTLAGAPHGGAAAVLDDALNAAFDELIASGGGPAWDEAGFAALRAHVAQRLPATTAAIVAPGGRRARRRRRAARPPGRAVGGRGPAAGAPRRRRPARQPRPPRLHRRHRHGPPARRRALPARRRSAASTVCPTPSPPTATR